MILDLSSRLKQNQEASVVLPPSVIDFMMIKKLQMLAQQAEYEIESSMNPWDFPPPAA